MKTIALVCTSENGHHQMTLRFFTRTLLELGYSVAVFTPSPDSLHSWVAANCRHLTANLRILEMRYTGTKPMQGQLWVPFQKMAWVRFVARSIRSAHINPDLVFHTWLDSCLTPGITAGMMDVIFAFPWTGLWFHPWYLRRKQKYSVLRRGPLTSHNALLSRNCTGVAILDEGVSEQLKSLIAPKPLVVFPDVADASAPDLFYPPASEIRKKARGRKIVALIGLLENRKGIPNLLEVARLCAREDMFFVFAGQWSSNSFKAEVEKEIIAFARTNPDNCYFLFERIPDEAQFNALIDIADVLFAVYENFLSSSNLLTKAALFRKPILVSESFCMGERVRRYRMGLAIPERDSSACIHALHRLCAPEERAALLQSARFFEYAKDHSQERLSESLTLLLEASGCT